MLILVLGVTSVLTFAVMSFIPDYYRSDDIVGYEEVSSTVAEGLHKVGVVLGFNFGDVHKTTDAIFPPHYVHLLKSDEFMARLMAIRVTTVDGQRMSYYAYLLGKPEAVVPDPYCLTEDEKELFDDAQKHILCEANTKKNLVKISVLDCDPMVCATMADSVRSCLQQFMMDYRKAKNLEEAAYFQKLTRSAREEYDRAVKAFNAFAEKHQNLSKGSMIIRQEKLQTDMLRKYRILQGLEAQYKHAMAKTEDRTAVFTPVQKAFVPVQPIGPKRLYTVLIMCLLVFVFSLLYFLRKDLVGQLIR